MSSLIIFLTFLSPDPRMHFLPIFEKNEHCSKWSKIKFVHHQIKCSIFRWTFFRIFLALSNTNKLNIECKLWKWSSWTRRSNGKYEAKQPYFLKMIFTFLLVFHFTNKSLRLNKRGNKFRTLLYNSYNVQIIHGFVFFIRVDMHVRVHLKNYRCRLAHANTCNSENESARIFTKTICIIWLVGVGGREALKTLFHENNSSRILT